MSRFLQLATKPPVNGLDAITFISRVYFPILLARARARSNGRTSFSRETYTRARRRICARTKLVISVRSWVEDRRSRNC
jgi:hypothetical protein